MHVKGETLLCVRGLWCPHCERCASVDPPPVSCRDRVVPLPHTHSGGYIQSSAGLSQMGILTRNPQQEMAGTTQWHPWEAGALQHPAAHAAALWDHHRGCVFLAEKPAEQRSQRSSPSSRTSPGTVLQEVSLAEVVSVGGSRMSSGLFPSPVVIRTGSRGWDRERAGGI